MRPSLVMRGTCWITLFLIACGPTGQKSHGGDDDDGDHMDAHVETYFEAAPGPDSSCGAQTQNIGVVNLGDPPDLLVVLDRSGSMADFPPPSLPPVFNSKWNIMKDALKSITAAKDMNIKFG